MTNADARELKTELAERGIKLVGVDSIPATTAIPTETVANILNASGMYYGRFVAEGNKVYHLEPANCPKGTKGTGRLRYEVKDVDAWLSDCVAEIRSNRDYARR